MTELFDLSQEKAVLGHVLSKHGTAATHAWLHVKETITHPLMFYGRDHKLVSIALDHLVASDMAIDIYAVSDALGSMSFTQALKVLKSIEGRGDGHTGLLTGSDAQTDTLLDAIGGYAFLADVSNTFLPADSVTKICQSIRDRYIRRRSSALAAEFTDSLQRHGTDYQTELANLSDRLNTIVSDEVRTVEIHDTIHETLNRGKSAEYATALWSLDELNNHLPLRKGRMYVLAGPAGSGKTSMAAEAAAATAIKYGRKSVLYVSIEMDRHEITNLIVSQQSQISVRRLEEGGLDDSEKDRVRASVAELMSDSGVTILDAEHPSHADVAMTAKLMAVSGKNLRLIIIDHMQIMSGVDPKQNEYERLSDISRSVKRLAKNTGAAVIALCQMNRSSMNTGYTKSNEAKGQGEPQMKDLRGSGTIEQDADAVAMMWNRTPTEDNPKQVKTLCLKKNRTGPCKKIDLLFKAAEGQRFSYLTKEAAEQLIEKGTHG